jgi:hypothetical protein
LPRLLRKLGHQRPELLPKATRFHGFVEDVGEFLAARRFGLVIEKTGGGFTLKTLDCIFNGVPMAAIRSSISGLPLTPGLDYSSFESMRELGEGVVTLIDNIERLNSMQQAAYQKCESGFDWSDTSNRYATLQRLTARYSYETARGDRVVRAQIATRAGFPGQSGKFP